MVAGGYLSYYGSVLQFYGVAVAGDGSVKDLYSYQFLFYSQFFLGYQCFAAYEFGFVKFAEDSKAGFYGADIGTEFVAVQGETGFKAQGVSAAIRAASKASAASGATATKRPPEV